MKTIKLGKRKIYKLSMSKFSTEEIDSFISQRKVILHKDTKPKGSNTIPQGISFRNAAINDLFYLTQGNGFGSIKLIGYFKSEARICTQKEYGLQGWLEREFELIATANITSQYEGESKWWTPNNNSAFIEIPKTDFNFANYLLFEPYFDIRII